MGHRTQNITREKESKKTRTHFSQLRVAEGHDPLEYDHIGSVQRSLEEKDNKSRIMHDNAVPRIAERGHQVAGTCNAGLSRPLATTGNARVEQGQRPWSAASELLPAYISLID